MRRPRPLQHHLHRRNLMCRAELNGTVAVPEIKRLGHIRRPPALRIQVQQVLGILNQYFHTREVHVQVYRQVAGRPTSDMTWLPSHADPGINPAGDRHLNHTAGFLIMGYSPTDLLPSTSAFAVQVGCWLLDVANSTSPFDICGIKESEQEGDRDKMKTAKTHYRDAESLIWQFIRTRRPLQTPRRPTVDFALRHSDRIRPNPTKIISFPAINPLSQLLNSFTPKLLNLNTIQTIPAQSTGYTLFSPPRPRPRSFPSATPCATTAVTPDHTQSQ